NWVLAEVVASVAEVAARVVDPGPAVLPGGAALEGDPHRHVNVGRVLLVADDLAADLVEHVRECDALGRKARNALGHVPLGDGGLVAFRPGARLLLQKLLAYGVHMPATRRRKRLVSIRAPARAGRLAMDVAEELVRERAGECLVRRGTGLIRVRRIRVVGEDEKWGLRPLEPLAQRLSGG